MEGIATAKYLRSSPRKLRQVMDVIRGKNVNEALDVLHFMPKKGARMIEKIIRSAIANLQHKEGARKVDVDDLIVKAATVDGGPMAKRYRPRAMGRASRIRKRFSHVTVLVGDEE